MSAYVFAHPSALVAIESPAVAKPAYQPWVPQVGDYAVVEHEGHHMESRIVRITGRQVEVNFTSWPTSYTGTLTPTVDIDQVSNW